VLLLLLFSIGAGLMAFLSASYLLLICFFFFFRASSITKPKTKMTKTRQICDDCGVKFEVAETEKYKTLCKPCFIEFKKMSWFC
jgi:uncharacterized membrane protein